MLVLVVVGVGGLLGGLVRWVLLCGVCVWVVLLLCGCFSSVMLLFLWARVCSFGLCLVCGVLFCVVGCGGFVGCVGC